jgi:hypothetical protein
MSVARLRLAPAGETMFPPRAPFFQERVWRAVHAGALDPSRRNLPVPPAPRPAHWPEIGQ